MSTNPCLTCGHPAGETAPQPTRCENCPPETCSQCGKTNHIATNQMCDCCICVSDIHFADLKALFAADGLSLRKETQ